MPQANHIAISPLSEGQLPAAALNALKGGDPNMLAFLAIEEAARGHANAITTVANRLFGTFFRDDETRVTIGVPGTSTLFLPERLAELAPQVALAATSAQITGALGSDFIHLSLRRETRPHGSPYWHTDSSRTHLINADEQNTVYAVANGILPPDRETMPATATLLQPPAGMPAAFFNIIHSRPYCWPPRDEPETPAYSHLLNIISASRGTGLADLHAPQLQTILRSQP